MHFPGYPFQSRYLDLGGIRLHYVDEGPAEGEVLLLVHGNPTWSYYYRRLIEKLSDKYRCIAPDHVGMGLSDKPGDDDYEYTLERRVDDLERLVEHLCLERSLTLILHDWGGMIGMAYAARHPASVRRLVVFNTAAFRLPLGKRLPWQLALCRLPVIGAILVRGLNLFCRGAVRACVKRRRLDREVRAAYLAPYRSWRDRIAVHRFVQDIPVLPGHRAYSLVKSVELELQRFSRLPTLLIWGLRDFVFHSGFLRGWEKRFPAAEVHSFPEAGHYVLEDEAENAVPLVRRFLEDNPLNLIP